MPVAIYSETESPFEIFILMGFLAFFQQFSAFYLVCARVLLVFR